MYLRKLRLKQSKSKLKFFPFKRKMSVQSLEKKQNVSADSETWMFTKLTATNEVFCAYKRMHKCLLPETKLTHTLVCINTGIFNSSIMTPFRIFFIYFVNSFRTVSVGKSIIHQVYLVIPIKNSKLKNCNYTKCANKKCTFQPF